MIEITLAQLRGMIGEQVHYRGTRCRVIEVIEDGPSLVLAGDGTVIQDDQFGDPARRVPRTWTVPVVAPNRAELHEEFLSLELV